ncbi:branched-chain amino acid ABC transporter permease [Natronomonas marina]|uniref:branched-chain amino acid ABC transporter permease n=1 Tax=Natronomonas marina TaxID=2961939 RepID=UPI0020C9668F|nr:branched-chain amino acid ABC transporter permease [Natronomonas marina]
MSGQARSGSKSWADILNPVEMQRHQQVGLLGILALFVLPVVLPAIYAIYLASALFFATFVMSWDFVSGYTGEISFGHGLFFGVGGYASGMLNLHVGIDPWIAAPLGAVAAGVAGLLIGFPSLRVKGPYFSLITLVTPIILISVFRFFPDWTGGELGLVSVGAVENFGAIGPIPSPGVDPYAGYYLALFVFLFALALFVAITRSDAGMVFTAIRADEISVAATGKNPAKFKLFAFVVSGLVGGFAGAMYGHSVGGFNVSELLALLISIEVIIAAILGGIGTITGAAVGGLFFYLLRVFIRNLDTVTVPFTGAEIELVIPLLDVAVGEIYFLLFGIVTFAFLFYLPEGIVPRVVGEWRARSEPQSGEAVADGGTSRGERVVESWTDDLRELFGGDRR